MTRYLIEPSVIVIFFHYFVFNDLSEFTQKLPTIKVTNRIMCISLSLRIHHSYLSQVQKCMFRAHVSGSPTTILSIVSDFITERKLTLSYLVNQAAMRLPSDNLPAGKREWVSLLILFIVNLLNYMDR